jgi:hypothetical protein
MTSKIYKNGLAGLDQGISGKRLDGVDNGFPSCLPVRKNLDIGLRHAEIGRKEVLHQIHVRDGAVKVWNVFRVTILVDGYKKGVYDPKIAINCYQKPGTRNSRSAPVVFKFPNIFW